MSRLACLRVILRAIFLLMLLRPLQSLVRLRSISPATITAFSSTSSCDPPEYDYHVPVMRDECCNFLLSGPAGASGIFVDCTVGGGGHTRALLEKGSRVVGLDQDPEAIFEASEKLRSYIDSGYLELIRTNFRDLVSSFQSSRLAAESKGRCDGVLMDLGISSHQIDEPGRGFAFGYDGPLDMRMGRSSNGIIADGSDGSARPDGALTAATICNEYHQDDIADILYHFGDETRSRRLAREIVACRPVATTAELVSILSRVTPFKERNKMLARCFQALRIAVNDEMGALDRALSDVSKIVKPGGRLVVLSYHSLEDRRVKRLLKTGHPGEGIGTNDDASPWNPLFKRAKSPSEDEIAVNRRARSAKLRVGERISVGQELLGEDVYLGAKVERGQKYSTGFVGEKERRKKEKKREKEMNGRD